MRPGDIIFVSASVPYRDGWTEDAHPAEIEEAIVSLARAVFARQGRLLFGGHPSVSPLIASVAGEYFPPDPTRRMRPIVTFQSKFYEASLPNETWMLYRMGWSSIEWTEKKEDKEASLKLMREWMLLGRDLPYEVIKSNQLAPPKAMVAIGGMEGVIDEARIFLDHVKLWGLQKTPVIYALPSGGAAAKRLVDPQEERFRQERLAGQIVDLEDSWKRGQQADLPSDLPFKPYAAIVQFMLDRLDA